MRTDKTTNSVIRKRLYLLNAVSFAVCYSVCCFVILPIVFYMDSDIAYESSVLPSILYYFKVILEIIAVSLAYATAIYGIYRLGNRNFRGIIVVFAASTAYKYFANVLVSWIFTEQSIPVGWFMDIVDVLYFTVLEAVQLLIVFCLAARFIGRYRNRYDAVARLGESVSDGDRVFPLKWTYDKSNCISKSVFVCAVITFAAKTLGTLVSDVWNIILYRLPNSASDIAMMIFAYVLNAVLGALCYFATVFALTVIFERFGDIES